MKKQIFILTVVAVLLVACGNSIGNPGDVFIGEWESGWDSGSLCNAPDIIKITKQDSNYFVDIPGEGKLPATYENNLLNFRGVPVSIGYEEKAGDTIVFYPSKKRLFRRTDEYVKGKDSKRREEVIALKNGIKGKWVLKATSSKADTYPILGLDLFVGNNVDIMIEKSKYEQIHYEYKFSSDSKKLIINSPYAVVDLLVTDLQSVTSKSTTA